jgi:hypothetical protein
MLALPRSACQPALSSCQDVRLRFDVIPRKSPPPPLQLLQSCVGTAEISGQEPMCTAAHYYMSLKDNIPQIGSIPRCWAKLNKAIMR